MGEGNVKVHNFLFSLNWNFVLSADFGLLAESIARLCSLLYKPVLLVRKAVIVH